MRLLGLPRLTVEDVSTYLRWHLLAARAELVHGPESSAWRRNTAGGTFAPARAWLGGSGGHDAALLVRRHLAAFGPAARADVAQWTGLTVGALEEALASLPLRRFRDEQGRELLDLPRAPRPPAGTPAPVRFLPTWDSSLLAHADRTRILPAEYRATVIRRNGDVQQTFLVDGLVAGLWRHEAGRIELEPFAPLPRDARRALDEEARALAAFHA
jgi:hypothetical protein